VLVLILQSGDPASAVSPCDNPPPQLLAGCPRLSPLRFGVDFVEVHPKGTGGSCDGGAFSSAKGRRCGGGLSTRATLGVVPEGHDSITEPLSVPNTNGAISACLLRALCDRSRNAPTSSTWR